MPGPLAVRASRREKIPGKIREQPGGYMALCVMDPWIPRGAFHIGEPEYGERSMTFVCPCGCGVIHRVKVQGPDDPPPDPVLGPCWAWDGVLDAPTLRPSLHMQRTCQWHGFLTAGVFEPV